MWRNSEHYVNFVVSLTRRILLGGLLLVCAGCSEDSAFGGRDTVWDTYDFRHPVPYDANVPESRATTYDRYQDYEQDYVPPRGYAPTPQPVQRQPYQDYEQDYVPPQGYQRQSYPYADYEGYYTPPKRQNYNSCIPGDPGCMISR